MNRFIMEEFHNDPALGRRLYAQAHRERARAIRAGLLWLIKRLTPRSGFLPARWLARLG